MFPRIKTHWRRFQPKNQHRDERALRTRDHSKDRAYLVRQQQPVFVCASTDMFDCAEQQVVDLLQRRPEVHDLERDIPKLQKKFERTKNILRTVYFFWGAVVVCCKLFFENIYIWIFHDASVPALLRILKNDLSDSCFACYGTAQMNLDRNRIVLL